MKQRRSLMLALALTCGAAVPSLAQHPFRGMLKWSVLLCDYTDSPASPRTLADVRDMFTGVAADGVAAYWFRASRGGAVSDRIEVRGFFRVAQTVATATAKGRWDRFNDCQSAAQAGGYTVPSGNGIVVMDPTTRSTKRGSIPLPGRLKASSARRIRWHGCRPRCAGRTPHRPPSCRGSGTPRRRRPLAPTPASPPEAAG